MIDEPFEKEQFRGAGVQFVIEIRQNAFVLHLSGERRVGENDIELLAWIGAAETGGERVQHGDPRLFQLVEIEVEDGDFYHVGVVVEAGEGMLFEELPLCRLEHPAVREAALQICRFGVLPENVGEG